MNEYYHSHLILLLFCFLILLKISLSSSFSQVKNYETQPDILNGIDLLASSVSQIAGSTTSIISDGVATSSGLNNPIYPAVDSLFNVYFCESNQYSVRKFPIGGSISRYAGTYGSNGYSGDGGSAMSALISGCNGLVADSYYNLYIADTLNCAIRIVEGSGQLTCTRGYIYTYSGSETCS